MSEGLNKRCWTSSLFISMHRTQQLRSGWLQMLSGGSIVGKASLIDPEISPTSPLIFTRAIKKCEIWRYFQHHSTLSRPRLKMQHGIRTLKQNFNAAMIALCPRRLPPENRSVIAPPLKLYGENVLNRQQLSHRLFDFAQILQRV